jgi:hypothetical protein
MSPEINRRKAVHLLHLMETRQALRNTGRRIDRAAEARP